MKISIIHASRSRPEQAMQTSKSWLSSAKDRDNIEYILSIDVDETAENKIAYSHIQVDTVVCWQNKSAIEAINKGASIAKGDLLIVVSDDFNQVPFHWDRALVSALEGKEDFLVKTDDGAQPWIITLPIMDRKYYERYGYIYNPAYRHLFADTEMTHVGHILGKVIEIPIRFNHNHYTTGKVAKDAINEKNDATWAQGEKVYLERLDRNFFLPIESIAHAPLECCHSSHMSWLKQKGVM